uniref:Putative acyltransferase n=1 Tax=termite gut metagenome TaxID=433724 RepID=S0DDT0_9ZZZZ
MRRYDIDSLRVIAFALLILYHVGMFFVPWGFHLKNNVIYPEIRFPMLFLNQWRLPLLFVISGMGTWFALGKRSGGQFAGERLKRLLVPFLFGCLFIVPPQIYFERLAQGAFSGSYFFDFWPANFTTGAYPEGNISWHHLWFILYLLIFSLLLIPAFFYLKKHPECRMIRWTQALTKKRFGLYAFVIPLFILQATLSDRFPSTNALVGDWFNLANYCTLFFFGFLLLTTGDGFWNNVTRNRWMYLGFGAVCFPLLILGRMTPGDFFLKGELLFLVGALNMWSWILAIFGFAATCLNRPSKAISYANEAVYPFYILHQTVLIVLAYYLMDIDMAFWPKFSIMVVGTFGGCWLIYEFCIRRWSVMRLLFGMKRRDNCK